MAGGDGALLVGDIGGTNGRFAVVSGDSLGPEHVGVEPGDDHESFEGAVAAYLEKLGRSPQRAAFAVAGPVTDGRVARITNRKAWEIDAGALEQRFGFQRVDVFNDFVAQAASLPHLGASDLVKIGDAAPRAAAKAALGPGTGLGVAGLLPEPGGGWRPVESEGGHVEFAAIDAQEAAAFEILRRARGRVSAEDVVSGPGLVRLHHAFAMIEGRTGALSSPAEITDAAKGGDAAALATIASFLSMLARFAGDVGLTFGARGGVYLCGGVAPRLVEFLDPASFRAAFEAKEPHRAMMEGIATVIVTSPVAGLVGAAAEAKRANRDAGVIYNR